MAIVNRRLWLRLESRIRDPGSDEVVSAQYITGSQMHVPPAKPTDLAAEPGLGAVTFSWNPVTKTAAGKPLEALARYALYYKKDPNSPIPEININNPSTYDEVIYVDNTQITIPVGRQYVEDEGDWRDEYIAARVVALDRSHRRGKASDQVESQALATRIPQVVDAGYIYEYNMIYETEVWNFPTFYVQEGYELLPTVWPLLGQYLIPGSEAADFYGYIEQHYYGLFFADELDPEGVPVLEAGVYTNLSLVIYHYSMGVGYFTCFEDTNSRIPFYVFDYDNPGTMRIGDYLIEATDAFPGGLGALLFQPVLYMVWRVRL